MPTVAAVQSAIRTRLEANFTALPLRWQNEHAPLPDDPTGFVHVEIDLRLPNFVAFGGGRGQNLQRVFGEINAHVLMPAGTGLAIGLQHAESICAVFRGLRVDDISYDAASPLPGTGTVTDGNYAHAAEAYISLYFDSLG
jgi:hypothetical protein